MARPTKQEIDEWNARMAEPEEDSDEDFEVVLFSEDGRPVGTMPYSKAKVHFKKHGIDLDDIAPAGDISSDNANPELGSVGGSAQPGNSAPRARASQRYFAGRSAQPPEIGGAPGTIPPDGPPAR